MWTGESTANDIILTKGAGCTLDNDKKNMDNTHLHVILADLFLAMTALTIIMQYIAFVVKLFMTQ